jgi:hypothetical protein
MPMPKSIRQMMKVVRLGAKPLRIDMVEKKTTLSINGRRRP